ncbi:MAG TPA: GatB/YqeY domain-containing protein [Chloroflexota bacterium]|jgi:uncharacterized protein YqeY|nr:GatB/YqeY domain-containing protein [Chloroflexota bacterium]
MGLREEVAEDLKQAMRQRDEIRVSTLRLLSAAIKNLEVERTDLKNPAHGKPVTEEDLRSVVRKQIKMRDEAIEGFRKGGNTVAAEREAQEKEILQEYLPRQLSRDEVVARVRELVAEHGRSFPVIIKLAMSELKDQAEGRTISEVVRELTSEGRTAHAENP